MRIALVSPYSWSFPGGVTRHIEALADQFEDAGHLVRIFAPWDPDDRLGRALHRGARPQPRSRDPRVVSLGRSLGFRFNGAVSNVAITPSAVATLRHHLRHGEFDVIHVHEPVAPIVGWDALGATAAPLVGTFHAYSTNALTNGFANLAGARRRINRLHVRIAVSEAAAWTGRRFFGGRYRVIPNGVELDAQGDAAAVAPDSRERDREPGEMVHEPVGGDEAGLRILFVGQAVERKGLPVLLRAYEAMREHVPATLAIVGAEAEEVAPLLLEERGVRVLGKVSDADKRRELQRADVLCAPSLGAESFGMVLTEAFAAGTPVIASGIAGYRDVVCPGVDGMLVPPGDATALAEALRGLALDHARRREMARAAGAAAQRYAWPRVAERVLEAYDDARRIPEPQGARARLAARAGVAPADLGPRLRSRRLPPLDPPAEAARGRLVDLARRAALVVAALGGAALAVLALARIGLDRIVASLLASSPSLVIGGLGLMCASMLLRGVAWHAILRAAMPGARVRRADAMQGTFIGVLMSATLPARLGEPARAMIVARRIGQARESLPAVLGTLASQTLLNLVALGILGGVMFSSVHLFDGHHDALLAATIGPVALAASVLIAPLLLPAAARTRHARLAALTERLGRAVKRARRGLSVFRHPRFAATATGAQLSAWALQWLACYVLLAALGLDRRAGLGAAAAVLLAVNVTAVVPATPSNLGVFQAACVAVLHGAFHVSSADALAYGIILQAVEITTAVVMGMPALVKEGLSWRDVRLRTLHAAPVKLAPRTAPHRRPAAKAEGQLL
jgi:phosphatidylinositol alpha-mannosyltransferase